MGSAVPQVRGERLVAKVLEATLQELAIVGYRALSIEVVADRASVNKTSIYRRWPAKAELVTAAFRLVVDELLYIPDEGSLRVDLAKFVRRFRDFAQSARGRGLFRVMAAEGEHSELHEILATIKESTRCIPDAIVARAIQRGEIPKGFDARLLVHCVVAPIMNWIQMDNLEIDDRRIDQVIDLLLVGASNGGGFPIREAS